MAKKQKSSGLGRGLDSLIPKPSSSKDSEESISLEDMLNAKNKEDNSDNDVDNISKTKSTGDISNDDLDESTEEGSVENKSNDLADDNSTEIKSDNDNVADKSIEKESKSENSNSVDDNLDHEESKDTEKTTEDSIANSVKKDYLDDFTDEESKNKDIQIKDLNVDISEKDGEISKDDSVEDIKSDNESDSDENNSSDPIENEYNNEIANILDSYLDLSNGISNDISQNNEIAIDNFNSSKDINKNYPTENPLNATENNDGLEFDSSDKNEDIDSLLSKEDEKNIDEVIEIVEKNPRITLWSAKSAAVLRYLRKTEPEFSISKEASKLIDDAIAKKYPEIWSLFNHL